MEADRVPTTPGLRPNERVPEEGNLERQTRQVAKGNIMAKPSAFISHINEEREIANYLKQLIDDKFLRSIETFASSHEESIHLGDEWLTPSSLPSPTAA